MIPFPRISAAHIVRVYTGVMGTGGKLIIIGSIVVNIVIVGRIAGSSPSVANDAPAGITGYIIVGHHNTLDRVKRRASPWLSAKVLLMIWGAEPELSRTGLPIPGVFWANRLFVIFTWP